MAKYCNAACKKKHRKKHKKECEEHVAEKHDEELFKQPPPKEDCPICLIQIPSMQSGSRYQICCGKVICSGCFYAPVYDDQGNEVESKKCPFCRSPLPKSNEEIVERIKKRVELGDPIAIYNHGNYYRNGRNGFPQDANKAAELYHRVADLGHAMACCSIGYVYDYGEGVEVDKKKALHYYEQAAIRGDETARLNLGITERNAGNFDRAVKHFMIAVGSGCDRSPKKIQQLYLNGHATKEEYTKALQLYQAYLSEIKSPQRDKAAAAHDECYRYY